MLTLEEISERIKEGKKNNGRAIISNLKNYFEEKYPQDYIVKMLSDKYQINISLTNLKVLKNRYYDKFKNQNILKKQDVNIAINSKNQEIKKIESPIKNEPPIEISFDKLSLKEQLEKMEYMLDPANFPRERVKF